MSNENYCPICVDRVPDCTLCPCQHMICEICLPTWMEKGINNGCMLCRGRITEIILGDGSRIPMELPDCLSNPQYRGAELNEQDNSLYQTHPGVENNNDILTETTELINTETKKDNPCCCAIF